VARLRDTQGFSAVELLVVLVLTVTMVAIAAPTTSSLFGNLRLSGDARGLSNNTAVAKMRAAADFTRARLYVDLAARSYHIERFDRTPAPGVWTAETGTTSLSYRVNFGAGSLAAPPPNSQAAIGQAASCQASDGSLTANTACITFNSRGVPVDDAGLPTGNDALYITDGSAVYSITVAATGLIRTWKSYPSVASWLKQ
jgi:Tfp pilus assembly protein FimT